MRLYFDRESDQLFWQEFASDPFVIDVTDEPRFRHAAKIRGLKEPEVTSVVIEEPRTIKPWSMALAITKGYAKWERKPSDMYPTPVDGTESIIPLIQALSEKFEAEHGRPIKRIWEPACGDGRLARVLEWHGYEVVCTDIREHSGYGVGSVDFLHSDPAEFGWDIGEIDLVVTNPPFSLAREFIDRALTITPYVIMLTKVNYYSTQNRYAFFQEKRPAFRLDLTWRLAFLEEERGKSPLMDCSWLVWAPTDNDFCIFEPLLRRKYPGYSKKGVAASTQILEGELVSLIHSLRDFAERV